MPTKAASVLFQTPVLQALSHKVSRVTSYSIYNLARLPFIFGLPGGFGVFSQSSIISLIAVSEEVVQNRVKNANLLRLVTAYRERGHLAASINPLRTDTRYV